MDVGRAQNIRKLSLLLIVTLLLVSACTASGRPAAEQPLAALEERVADLEQQLNDARARAERIQAWNRESYDRVVAEKAELIAEVDRWTTFADQLGYDLIGAEYGWENAPRRTCGSNVFGFVEESAETDLRTGPVLFAGALTYASQPTWVFEPVGSGKYRGHKILTVVDAGERVLVVLPAEETGKSSLLWAIREPMESYAQENTRGPYPVWVGERAVIFEACPDYDTSFDRGLTVAGARCVPLEVYVEGNPTPIRVAIPFGVPECP
jgi:hypothetical protein